MRVVIEGGHVKFTLDIDSKISIITGMSAKHKTWMTNAADIGEPAYKISISSPGYSIQALRKSTWADVLTVGELNRRKCIYIADDQDFVGSHEFARAVKNNKTSYFIIINRVTGSVSYDVRSMYTLESTGKDHFLQPMYTIPYAKGFSSKMQFYTEDSTSGFRWFKELVPQIKTTGGVANISKVVASHTGACLCIAADLFGLGYYYQDIIKEANKNSNTIMLMKDYGSFEYLLLCSNMFRYTLSEQDILGSMSKEIACEKVITTLTSSKYYKYEKSYDLCYCYYKDCCAQNRKDKCDKGLSGEKIEALLVDTEFEYLLKLLHSSDTKCLMAQCIKDMTI